MTPPAPDVRVRRAAEVVFQELEGEAVIVNLDRGTCFTLDPVGTRIWQLLGEEERLARVAHALTLEFDVDEETATSELHAIVGDLLARGLLIAA